MSEAPRINYGMLAPEPTTRDRARVVVLRNALLQIAAIIETQPEPDIDSIHDVVREALVSSK